MAANITNPASSSVILTGRIVRKKKFQRHISLAIQNKASCDDKATNDSIDKNENQGAVSIPILIDRTEHQQSLPWCCLGAWIRVHVRAEETSNDGDSTEIQQEDSQKGHHRVASKVELVHCAPDPNAVKTCLTLVARNELPLNVFSNTASSTPKKTTRTAPLLQHLRQVTEILEAPREIQRREIAQLVRGLKGLSIDPNKRVTSQRTPHTKQRYLRVLERLEQCIPLVDIYKSQQDNNTSDTDEDNSIDQEIDHMNLICNEHHQHQFPINLPDGIGPADKTIVTASNRVNESNARFEYLQQKKWPQIQWIVQRLTALGEANSTGTPQNASTTGTTKRSICFRHVLDVGGGRGDLATTIAMEFPNVYVTVVDCNESSLQAGQMYAEQLGVANRMTFHCADFTAFVKAYDPLVESYTTATTTTTIANSSPLPIDAVVALHACGDLSDLALQFASQQQASFVICPCCYTKRYIKHYEPSWIQCYKNTYYCQPTPSVSTSPTTLPEKNAIPDIAKDDGTSNENSDTPRKKKKKNTVSPSAEDEVAAIQRLAELNERPEISQRAMRVISSLRLNALDTASISTDVVGKAKSDITAGDIRLEEYENKISMRNLVLVGKGK